MWLWYDNLRILLLLCGALYKISNLVTHNVLICEVVLGVNEMFLNRRGDDGIRLTPALQRMQHICKVFFFQIRWMPRNNTKQKDNIHFDRVSSKTHGTYVRVCICIYTMTCKLVRPLLVQIYWLGKKQRITATS